MYNLSKDFEYSTNLNYTYCEICGKSVENKKEKHDCRYN